MIRQLNVKRFIVIWLFFVFFGTSLQSSIYAYGDTIGGVGSIEFRLPDPGVMVPLSPAFDPAVLKGIKVHPDNPFRFDFILDKGDSERQPAYALTAEATKLIKYFLASLTIPEKDLWVNLSPYEEDRIIPPSFGLTQMGRDLLAEDYMLKQITASLIYPDDAVGRKFWKRVYEEAARRFGTTNIPVNTFNKVWIVPEKAVVYENAKAGTAYVVEAKLKVMLEQDYLSLEKHEGKSQVNLETTNQNRNETALIGTNIVREIVIPELTKEVNEGKNFAQLRQVYNSLILATWYKKKIKDSILEQVYEDENKIKGVGYEQSIINSGYQASKPLNVKAPQMSKPGEVELIYQQYLKAFKKGVYNFIKEETDPLTQETIPRKYFSGGVVFNLEVNASQAMTVTTVPPASLIINGLLVKEESVPADSGDDIEARLRRELESIPVASWLHDEDLLVHRYLPGLELAMNNHDLDLIAEYDTRLNKILQSVPYYAKQTSPISTIDEQLAFIVMEFSKDYLKRVNSLVALNRPLASLLVFAANGPHTRREYTRTDRMDLEAQEILINGFIGHLKELLDLWDKQPQKQVLAQLQEYTGGLFNGLLMRTELPIEELVDRIANAVTVTGNDGKVIDLREIIKRSVKFLPKKLPTFMGFVGQKTGVAEYGVMRSSNLRVTMREIFLGVPSSNAEAYMKKEEKMVRDLDFFKGEIAPLESTERDYQYLRHLPPRPSMSVDGAMKAIGGGAY